MGDAGLQLNMAWNFNTYLAARAYGCEHVNKLLCDNRINDVHFITPGAPFEKDMSCMMIGAQERGPLYYEDCQNAGWKFTDQTIAGYKSLKDHPPLAPRPLAKRTVRHKLCYP